MNTKTIRRGLKRSALSLALGMCFAGTVQAQSTAGSVFGQAVSGDTIVVENAATGFKREVAAGADGSYRASSLPTGSYRITVTHADGSTQVREAVIVSGGVGTPVNFAGGGDAAMLDTIEVTGSSINAIDVSSAESSTIINEATIDRLPVARSVTAVTLLAPGTTLGDSRLSTLHDKPLASIGGSSVAENAYYINGFNVTNIVSGTTYSEVPFEAVSETQIKTGGYGAEFGRSLGGVVNVITKKGGNDWQVGGNVIWDPDAGRATKLRAVKTTDTREWELVPVDNYSDTLTGNLYLSGPIFRDRLFVYALAQGTDSSKRDYFNTRSEKVKQDQPQYLVKLDWNINDNHLLELTAFNDETQRETTTFINPTPYGSQLGDEVGSSIDIRGGENLIGKWTGYLTDNFTLSALYGVGKYSRDQTPGDPALRDDCPFVQDQRSSPVADYGCWVEATWVRPGSGDKRTAWRVDGEWFIGDHTIKFGIDDETYETVDGTVYTGPDQRSYILSTLTPGSSLPPAYGYTNATGANQDVVAVRTFRNGGVFETRNSAWYVSDTWQVNDNLLVTGGLRNESFNNLNAQGDSFIEIKDTWAPRLGFSWDVNGDSSMKVFGSAGRYYIPVYANTNVRLSGAEDDFTTYYAWDGSFSGGPDQTPGLGAQLGNTFVTSDGTSPDARTVVDPNIEPMYQDEYILGFQKQLSKYWSVGVRGIRRELKSGMDDYCSYDFPYDWAIGAGYTPDEADAIGNAVNHCFLMNPGQDLTMNVDLDGSGNLTTLVIPAAATGLPKAERKYNAVDVFFERSWDGKWFLQGSYTWAQSYGNTEGYVKSDNGQDDAGITLDFDYPGLTEGRAGYLPNDRRHSLKVFGAYQLTEEWRVGGNLLIQTGRPISCYGYYRGTSDPASSNYGSNTNWCPVDGVAEAGADGQLYNRASFGRLPTTKELGLNVSYEPRWFEGSRFSVDVFNVFNEREVTSIDERAEIGGINSPRASYQQPLSVQGGRRFRLTFEYDFK